MITDTFLKLKSNLEPNVTFADSISRQHNAVRSVIENNGQSIQETKLIGSLHKHRQTRIQPKEGDIFDIDILVVLGDFNSWVPSGGVTPQMAMSQVHSFVQQSDRYSAMGPQQDHPTVTFEYANDVKVELVPAYRDRIGHSPDGTVHTPNGRGYWIPNSSGGWDLADYDYDAEYISTTNAQTGGLLVPVIKMMKAVKRKHFASLKSFPLEIIAVQLVPNIIAECRRANIAITYPTLVAWFIHNMGSHLNTLLRIPGSNTKPVYIEPSIQTEVVSALNKINGHSTQALIVNTDADKHALWREIFGEILPLP